MLLCPVNLCTASGLRSLTVSKNSEQGVFCGLLVCSVFYPCSIIFHQWLCLQHLQPCGVCSIKWKSCIAISHRQVNKIRVMAIQTKHAKHVDYSRFRKTWQFLQLISRHALAARLHQDDRAIGRVRFFASLLKEQTTGSKLQQDACSSQNSSG